MGENERIFWEKIYVRLLPLQVGVHAELQHRIDPGDLAAALEQHGLPRSMFGYDRPSLIEGAPLIEAKPNGQEPPEK
jgi:hypothetical protein